MSFLPRSHITMTVCVLVGVGGGLGDGRGSAMLAESETEFRHESDKRAGFVELISALIRMG